MDLIAEDPGAANFIAPLPAELAALGVECRLWAKGGGAAVMSSLNVAFNSLFDMSPQRFLARGDQGLLAVGTSEDPEGFGLAVIGEARKRGVPSIGLVDGPANAERRFRGSGETAFANAPDRILVPDTRTRDRYLALGFDADRVEACGHPHVDRVRAERRRLDKVGHAEIRRHVFPKAGSRSVVVFLAELSDGLNPAEFRLTPDYTLRGRGRALGRTEIVLEEVLEAISALPARPYFVLRLHPKNRPEDYVPYKNEIDVFSEGGSVLDALYGADVVIGMTSIALLEAALLGRPVLSVIPRSQEREWLTIAAAGAIPVVTSRDTLGLALSEALAGRSVIDQAKIVALYPPGASRRAASSIERYLTVYSGA